MSRTSEKELPVVTPDGIGAFASADLDPGTFQDFCQLIYDKSGITLKPGKESLVASRLSKRMRALGIATYQEYYNYVTNGDSSNELVHMLDAISTNLTSFFRESVHFDIFRDVLTEWRDAGQLRYRLWCAAASTGEEPYSIAMTCLDVLGEGKSDTRILATDISTRVLRACKEGVYRGDRMATVPPQYRERFFERTGAADGGLYAVKKSMRQMMAFKRLNLATPPFPMRGPLDVVFCRNVMIYFDDVVRQRLIDEMHRLLKPGGYLIVGHSESLTRLNHSFETIAPAVYKKR